MCRVQWQWRFWCRTASMDPRLSQAASETHATWAGIDTPKNKTLRPYVYSTIGVKHLLLHTYNRLWNIRGSNACIYLQPFGVRSDAHQPRRRPKALAQGWSGIHTLSHTHTHTLTRMCHGARAYVWHPVYKSMCMFMCMQPYVCARTCVSLRLIYLSIYLSTYLSIYTYIYNSNMYCVYIYTYEYIYTYIYTHTKQCSRWSLYQ